MILQRVEQAEWLSNAYLIVDRPGGSGVLVDSNGVTEPLTERIEREGTEITHILLTHSHWDHVFGAEELAKRYGVPVVAHEATAEQLEGVVTETIDDGDEVSSGELTIRALYTPGHCPDHLALLVDGTDCLTADALFAGTVGGTLGGGPDGFAQLRNSIMERLMKLDGDVRIHPGHRVPSTIGAEWESNPFVRVWRGLDEEGSEACTIGPPDAAEREQATLVLWAPDYDGGNKAWVRYPDGRNAIVGGSQVKRGE